MSLWQSYITNWWLFNCVLCPIVVVPCVQAQPGLWVPPYLRELPQTPKPVAFVTSRRKNRWSRSSCLPAIFPLWCQSWKWSRKKERSRDRLGCTKSSSLVHFDRTLAGLLFLHTRGDKVCNISSFNQKITINILAAFFCISNVEVVEYIHKEHRCLTWRVLVHMPVHHPPIRGIVCDDTSVQNKHRKTYKRCIVQKKHKGCTLHMLSSGNTRKK